jgi:hypothetical protein
MLVRRFEPKDAERLSQLILENLQQVNINDYPQETIAILAQAYTPERIIERARQYLTLVGLVDCEGILLLNKLNSLFQVETNHARY